MSDSERLQRDLHQLKQLIDELERVIIDSEAPLAVVCAALAAAHAGALSAYAEINQVPFERLTGMLQRHLELELAKRRRGQAH